MTTATAQPAARPAGLKKLNLGGIAPAAADARKSTHPVLPDGDGAVAKLVDQLRADAAQLEVLEGNVKIGKAELTARVRPFYFEHCHGKSEVPSSVSCRDSKGNEVLVTLSNRYYGTSEDAALLEAVGPELAERFFRQSFQITVDGDAIPGGKQQEVIDALVKLFADHGCPEAMKAKAIVAPTPEFHTARHAALSVEQNLAVERLCPCTAIVKTKGRKKD